MKHDVGQAHPKGRRMSQMPAVLTTSGYTVAPAPFMTPWSTMPDTVKGTTSTLKNR